MYLTLLNALHKNLQYSGYLYGNFFAVIAVFRLIYRNSTLLTVGYGDIYPITTLGRIMAICIAYLRVGVVAIPTGIISAGFVEQYQRKSNISDLKDMDIKENTFYG